ncbi:CNT_collapsed_G0036860.mRNA.1.CDS.1 [Saccharomyces cerevisiae]|nr:CNT_collapsed_G0036860.mRNA.1.CDS.1 [Saccharomyces cerevisiae]
MTTGSINQITILKEEATSFKRKPNSPFFHLFPLCMKSLGRVWKQMKFQKNCVSGLSAAGNTLCSKASTLLTSAASVTIPQHSSGFPLIRFQKTDTPVFHGMVRSIPLDLRGG